MEFIDFHFWWYVIEILELHQLLIEIEDSKNERTR